MATHPVVLPQKSHGQRRLVDYSPWGCKQLDTTEPPPHIHTHTQKLSTSPEPIHVSFTWRKGLLRIFKKYLFIFIYLLGHTES